jgi:hypothetical protein
VKSVQNAESGVWSVRAKNEKIDSQSALRTFHSALENGGYHAQILS